MTYLNIALIPLPADAVEAYQALAEQMADLWLGHGALAYQDFVGEDLDVADKGAIPLAETVDLEDEEALLLATLRFTSREHRDEVEAKVMADSRVGEIMSEGLPFDPSRISGGGFELLVEG